MSQQATTLNSSGSTSFDFAPVLGAELLAAQTDEALMAAYAAGDERSFRALFDRHGAALFRAVRRRVDSDDDAHDIVQQTLLNVHRARTAFDTDRKLRPWLFAIAMNLVREHYRRSLRRNERSLDAQDAEAGLGSVSPVEDMAVTNSVRVAMRSLLANQREVIELRWFEGHSYEEISELVGASVSAVRVRAHRGYERLRGALEAQA